jgi:hypothetical protein
LRGLLITLTLPLALRTQTHTHTHTRRTHAIHAFATPAAHANPIFNLLTFRPFPALALSSLFRSLHPSRAYNSSALYIIAVSPSFRAASSCISSDHTLRIPFCSGYNFFLDPFATPASQHHCAVLPAHVTTCACTASICSCLNVAARFCDVSGCAATPNTGRLITISVGHVEVQQQRISQTRLRRRHRRLRPEGF